MFKIVEALIPQAYIVGLAHSTSAQSVAEQSSTKRDALHIATNHAATEVFPHHTQNPINLLKMRCRRLLNMNKSKMQECMRNAEKGLKYHDIDDPDPASEDDDIISEVFLTSSGASTPHLAKLAMMEEVKSSGQLFSGKSEWLMQVWAWFLVVVAFLSALKARKRSIRPRTKLLSF